MNHDSWQWNALQMSFFEVVCEHPNSRYGSKASMHHMSAAQQSEHSIARFQRLPCGWAVVTRQSAHEVSLSSSWCANSVATKCSCNIKQYMQGHQSTATALPHIIARNSTQCWPRPYRAMSCFCYPWQSYYCLDVAVICMLETWLTSGLHPNAFWQCSVIASSNSNSFNNKCAWDCWRLNHGPLVLQL